MTILQVPAIAFYITHTVASSAYLPEISNVQAELNTAGAYSTTYLFVTEVAFTMIVTAIGLAFFGLDDSVNTCRVSQAIIG